LPKDWPIAGTTGYDFLNYLNGIFIDRANAAVFSKLYREFTGCVDDFERVLFACRKEVLLSSFPGRLRFLVESLESIGQSSVSGRDIARSEWETALTGLLCAFPVYRTYICEPSACPSGQDRKAIETAILRCRKYESKASKPALEFIRRVLYSRPPEDCDEKARRGSRTFTMRLQQLTAPLAAKGLEDTACYVFNRLISLNEVGGNPGRFGHSTRDFHALNRHRAAYWPHSMIATGTHDAKRGEDVRARINVLSEMPGEWKRRVARWRKWNACKKHLAVKSDRSGDGVERWDFALFPREREEEMMPDWNDEYFFYQSLIGAWPFEDRSGDGPSPREVEFASGDEPSPLRQRGESYADFCDRISNYMIKAVREAKRYCSWTERNPAYEEAVECFVRRVLAREKTNCFLEDFVDFQRRVAYWGVFNSLAQVALKIAAPGVADFYQGTELWDLNLVDPDNRRPVDHTLRKKLLEELKGRLARATAPGSRLELCRELLLSYQTGEVKLFVTWLGLQLRREKREVFEKGGYVPIRAAGQQSEHACAFIRKFRSEEVIVVAPRLVYGLCRRRLMVPVGTRVWGETRLFWPGAREGVEYRNQFTGEILQVARLESHAGLRMAEVLATFPVALLHRV
jgi:(1->4)-alpha-D-glucan 1-alpha-D-glucosylmutase